MATAHGVHRAIFVSLDVNGEINNFDLFLPISPLNGKSDLCNLVSLILDKKPYLSSNITDSDNVKFEKESQFFKSRFVEITKNDVLEHGTVLMGKLVKQGLVIPTNSTKEHENLTTGKILYGTYKLTQYYHLKPYHYFQQQFLPITVVRRINNLIGAIHPHLILTLALRTFRITI